MSVPVHVRLHEKTNSLCFGKKHHIHSFFRRLNVFGTDYRLRLRMSQLYLQLQVAETYFFWSSGIMQCTCMLFTFENGVPLMRQVASVVWHHSLLLMNGFNKTEAAVFSCRLCFLGAFPFINLIMISMIFRISYVFIIFSVFQTLKHYTLQNEHVFTTYTKT